MIFEFATYNIDFAVHRFFPIPVRESMQLEFRGEFYNVLNRTKLGTPETSLGLPQPARSLQRPHRTGRFSLD